MVLPAELIRKTDDGQAKPVCLWALKFDPGRSSRTTKKNKKKKKCVWYYLCIVYLIESATSLSARITPAGVLSLSFFYEPRVLVLFGAPSFFFLFFLLLFLNVSFNLTRFLGAGTLPTGAANETRPPPAKVAISFWNRSNITEENKIKYIKGASREFIFSCEFHIYYVVVVRK